MDEPNTNSNHDHIILDKVEGEPYTCKCGLTFATLKEAMEHTPTFMNTPNAVGLFTALKAGQ